MTTGVPASLTFLPSRPSLYSPSSSRPLQRHPLPPSRLHPVHAAVRLSPIAAVKTTKGAVAASDELELDGMTPEFYDEEWQASQRERTKEWQAYKQKEEAEENIKANEYREIGMRLKSYPQEEVCKARVLVSTFIRAGEDVEKEIEKAAERGELTELVLMVIWNRLDVALLPLQEIEKAAERGELTELVLMVIWNRLDVARRDDEKDAIRSLDLLCRRVETEILRSEATPAMRLLNDLLNLHDGSDDDKWLKACRKNMIEVFPREDPFTMVFPAGFDMEKHDGQIKLPPPGDDVLLRVDFVREVDELLKEVQAQQENNKLQTGYDPESVATMLKQQEKLRTINQVEALLELAASLKW